jgi:Predicted aminoglycoside phosphotransferase
MESATKNKQSKDIIIKMAQKAFQSNLKPEEVQILELSEGFFNVAYEITMPQRSVILKIAPPMKSQIMSYEKNIMKAEVEGLRLVKEKTKLPVPEIFYYDNSGSLCGADYFFMEKLYGESLYKLKGNGLAQDKYDEIVRETGKLNREINQIEGSSFGYFGQPEKQGSCWRVTFLAMLEDVLADGENIEISLGVEYDTVRDLIEKAAFSLEEVKKPVFVHWDLWDGNVFVKDDKVSGIIDFERSLWGDPLMEYFFRRNARSNAFMEGYGDDLRKAAPVRALLYDMYLYLIMVIETKYRKYTDDWQYNYAVNELQAAIGELKTLL